MVQGISPVTATASTWFTTEENTENSGKKPVRTEGSLDGSMGSLDLRIGRERIVEGTANRLTHDTTRAPFENALQRTPVRPPSAPASGNRPARTASEPTTKPRKSGFSGVLRRKTPRFTLLGQRPSPSRITPPHAGHGTPTASRSVTMTLSPAGEKKCTSRAKPAVLRVFARNACFSGDCHCGGPDRRSRTTHQLGVGLENARHGVSCPPSLPGFDVAVALSTRA